MTTEYSSKRRRGSPLMVILTGLIALYVSAFLIFVVALPKPASGTDDAPNADAIVALTGEGTRLAPAIGLLEQHKGKRLLITGVNPRTTRAELRTLLHGGADFDCCADLGFEATDTLGNAVETARWAKDHGYKHIIVVTATYHMPRSMLEFSHAMPDVRLTPYAVAPETQSTLDFWQSLPRLGREFGKYVAALARIAVFPHEEAALIS